MCVCTYVNQKPFVWAACCGRGPIAWPQCCCASCAQGSVAGWTDCADSDPRSSAAPDARTPSSSLHPIPRSPSCQSLWIPLPPMVEEEHRGRWRGWEYGSPRKLLVISESLQQSSFRKRLWNSLQKRNEWWGGGEVEKDAAMVSLISLIVGPRWCPSLWVRSTVSCQHLLSVRSDFHNSKHTYRATERERKRESARRGREMGGWMGSCCQWAALLLQMLMDTPPKREKGGEEGTINSQWEMRGERGWEREREGAKAKCWTLFCSVLWPLVNLSQSWPACSGSE